MQSRSREGSASWRASALRGRDRQDLKGDQTVTWSWWQIAVVFVPFGAAFMIVATLDKINRTLEIRLDAHAKNMWRIEDKLGDIQNELGNVKSALRGIGFRSSANGRRKTIRHVRDDEQRSHRR